MIEPNLYDDEQLAKIRKDQEDPWVMYFIVRTSLDMSAGKIAAQCAHGAQMVLLRYLNYPEMNEKTQAMAQWLGESFRKIVLAAKDNQWEKVKEEPTMSFCLVRDAGLTEIDPNSETVLVSWPIRKSNQPKIIKRLRLLK